MDQTHFAFRLVLVLLIIAVNAFFAGAEVALISVRESRLKQMAEEGRAGAHAALQLLAKPERLLSVTQVGVTLASLGLGWAGEDTLYQMMLAMAGAIPVHIPAAGLHAISFIVAFLIISYCHVVIGEVVPKNLAIEKADRLALTVAPGLLLFYRLSSAFVYVVEKSAAAMSRAMGLRGAQRGGGHSAEELKLIVSSSRGLGYLPERQEDMIHRVLDLHNVSVREIMVPRNDIISVPIQAELDAILHTMIEHRHSRLPVYKDQPEQIIGVLHYKDLLPVWEERRSAIRAGRPPRVFRVRRVMRKHLVVPETKPVLQMLEEFEKARSQMAMVVDEFGTIIGLVTAEDVLEQVVGPIVDEYDEKSERPAVETSELELDGAMKTRDLENEYGIELPSGPGFETLAGFLLHRLGAIPNAGETIEHEGRRFTVLEMDRNRISRVRVEKVASAG
jgi:putative hemolysin